ncbi:hypothetical protein AB1285_24195, partial [Microbacterium sp. NRRL B-14842]|uniref:hypothetical protein n=1 Tax=Microbacterium sp. NRRL B-14842 TaxID=3162881 RepID=UPI003D2BD273
MNAAQVLMTIVPRAFTPRSALSCSSVLTPPETRADPALTTATTTKPHAASASGRTMSRVAACPRVSSQASSPAKTAIARKTTWNTGRYQRVPAVRIRAAGTPTSATMTGSQGAV